MIRYVVLAALRAIVFCIARVEVEGREHMGSAPAIIAINHINFLEIPIIYAVFRRYRVIGIAKAETWHSPFMRFLADVFSTIPIDRTGVDRRAFERALDEYRDGSWLLIAPEGTRSGDGRLRRAGAGIVVLVHRTGAPVLPVAHFGGERFWSNIRRFRRTRVTVRIGSRIDSADLLEHAPLSKAVRARATDRVMTDLAALLPPQYHGVYASPPLAGFADNQ